MRKHFIFDTKTFVRKGLLTSQSLTKFYSMQWYASWFDSPYYQILYDHRNDLEASRFIKRLVEYLKVPRGSRILDLACGNGRHSRQLAEMDMQVTGIDLSPASIQLARMQSCGTEQYFIHDMREAFHFGKFDYILNLFTSFGYFERDEEHLQVLRNIKQALNPEGIFVMDFLSLPYVSKRLIKEEKISKKGIDFDIRRKIEAGFIYKEIRFNDRGKEFIFVERVRAFDLEKLQKLFEQAGLQTVESFGSYELKPYESAHAPRLILIAQSSNPH